MSSYEIDTYRKWSARTTLNETWGGGGGWIDYWLAMAGKNLNSFLVRKQQHEELVKDKMVHRTQEIYKVTKFVFNPTTVATWRSSIRKTY